MGKYLIIIGGKSNKISALGDFTGNHTCGLSAIYGAKGQILNAEYGKTVMALG